MVFVLAAVQQDVVAGGLEVVAVLPNNPAAFRLDHQEFVGGELAKQTVDLFDEAASVGVEMVIDGKDRR